MSHCKSLPCDGHMAASDIKGSVLKCGCIETTLLLQETIWLSKCQALKRTFDTYFLKNSYPLIYSTHNLQITFHFYVFLLLTYIIEALYKFFQPM